jgi:hypothetical protein
MSDFVFNPKRSRQKRKRQRRQRNGTKAIFKGQSYHRVSERRTLEDRQEQTTVNSVETPFTLL